jgi:hypothetical protein
MDDVCRKETIFEGKSQVSGLSTVNRWRCGDYTYYSVEILCMFFKMLVKQ